MQISLEYWRAHPLDCDRLAQAWLSPEERNYLPGCSEGRQLEYVAGRLLAKRGIEARASSYALVSGEAYRHRDGVLRHVCLAHCEGLVIVSRAAFRHAVDVETCTQMQGLQSFWRRYAGSSIPFDAKRALRAWTCLEALAKLRGLNLLNSMAEHPALGNGLPQLRGDLEIVSQWLDAQRMVTVASHRPACQVKVSEHIIRL